MADLARKKLWNLDGRIEAGTALYVALQGGRNSSQCRAIVRPNPNPNPKPNPSPKP